MSKVTELENALTELFRKGTEVGYSETEIDEFLEDIDYDTLLQAVWNNAETVYSYRADGEHEFSMDYRGTELFKQRATLLYEDMGEGFAGAVVAARSMELWLLEDMALPSLRTSMLRWATASTSPSTVFTRAAIGRTVTLIWIWRTWLPSLPPCANPTTTITSPSTSCNPQSVFPQKQVKKHGCISR